MLTDLTRQDLAQLAAALKGAEALDAIEAQVQASRDAVATRLQSAETVAAVSALKATLTRDEAAAVDAQVEALRKAAGLSVEALPIEQPIMSTEVR
jgi:hypothetical protein